jgi:hypothetical protein
MVPKLIGNWCRAKHMLYILFSDSFFFTTSLLKENRLPTYTVPQDCHMATGSGINHNNTIHIYSSAIQTSKMFSEIMNPTITYSR